MMLSYTLPCHDREADLLAVLPTVVAAANQSPPVQIVIVDYGAKDKPLEPVLAPFRNALVDGNRLDVPVFRGTAHFHMAHARNIGIRACGGAFVVLSFADVFIAPDYFTLVRQRLAETGAVWITGSPGRHLFVVQREELLDAGGFDERFEFYGPEDKDLDARLQRRGALHAEYPTSGMISHIHTPRTRKSQGYRIAMSARDMYKQNWLIFNRNCRTQALTANHGLAWGQL